MGTEEAIIYSYDLATVPSVIPAFANAKDVLICDEVRRGCFIVQIKRTPLQLPTVPYIQFSARSR